MSQGIWDTIIPSTTSGNQLATLLNDLKDALMTGQSGSSRPSQTEHGGYWIDNISVADHDIYYHYDGSQDIEVYRINRATGKIQFPGTSGSFELNKISDDSVGPILKFLKSRIAGNGQTLAADILGQVDFNGTQDDGNEALQAKIEVFNTDSTTALAQGSEIAVSTTKTGTPNLSEKVRISNDGGIGLGTNAPENRIHARGDADKNGIKSEAFGDNSLVGTVSVKKKRVADSGQVKSADVIGVYDFLSTDQNGDEIVTAKIEAVANEDHTDVAQGVTLTILTKKDGTNTFQEAIKIEDGAVSILGISQGTDTKSQSNLEDTSLTRNLLNMDGSVYSSFEVFAKFRGRDNSETRMHSYQISGVYDPENTEWGISFEDSILKGSDPLVNLDIPSSAVENLVINYVNQFADIDFIDGKIYLDIRRTLV